LDLRAALDPPLDAVGLLDVVPELFLARELEGSLYHHLDTLDHVLEVVRASSASWMRAGLAPA
jgi:hypothetical protein